MGKGNKSVGQVHPIIRHMNKLGGDSDIKYNPIQHDEKAMGRGGHLGTAKGGTVYGPAKAMPPIGNSKSKLETGNQNQQQYPDNTWNKPSTWKIKGMGGIVSGFKDLVNPDNYKNVSLKSNIKKFDNQPGYGGDFDKLLGKK